MRAYEPPTYAQSTPPASTRMFETMRRRRGGLLPGFNLGFLGPTNARHRSGFTTSCEPFWLTRCGFGETLALRTRIGLTNGAQKDPLTANPTLSNREVAEL